MITTARYTNAERTMGIVTRDDGSSFSGPLPPFAGDLRMEYEAWLAAGGVPDPYVPPPDGERS